MLVRAGEAVTVKLTPLLVPLGVVAVTLPLIAPPGTTTPVILVPLALTVKPLMTVLALAPANVRTLVPCRLAPMMLSVVPTWPVLGVRLVMVGVTQLKRKAPASESTTL